MSAILIRPARMDECDALSHLAHRSKAHWGYDADFMARCREELTVTPSEAGAGDVFVAELHQRPAGVVSLEHGDSAGNVGLGLLFVDPGAMRRGIGRRLFSHAAEQARRRGGHWLVIQADPNAAAFYLAMGAVAAGELPSQSIPGRKLPLFVFSLGER